MLPLQQGVSGAALSRQILISTSRWNEPWPRMSKLPRKLHENILVPLHVFMV